ncbi:MAG: hypothetical protein ABT20_11555 [Rubrivivax sp. SCN 70-15]|nr:MAG: hypothetical protein ABT20_11555 [Rubrivivax sp. SCN 70-15]
MPRPSVRLWKRAVTAGGHEQADGNAAALARESALLLLRRSVDMGHRRLALIRLLEAIRLQAEVPPEHWAHCRAVIGRVTDPELRAAYSEPEQRSNACGIA